MKARLTPGPATPARKRLAEVGGVLIALVGFWLIFGLYVVHAFLPYNPVKPPFAAELRTKLWMPEGWAFFTRDPRSERVYYFVYNGATWVDASVGPQSRASNFFGLNRRARAQNVEAGLLLNEQRVREAWRVCERSPSSCLAPAYAVNAVTNASPRPTLCGLVGVARQRPIPWAWRRSRDRVVMPSVAVTLEVTCSRRS